MYAEDEYSKFTKRLSKLINTQWTKVTKSSSISLKSEKNIGQQLEEEYETLLREIDYLTSEKSCYLSFLNNNFNSVKSSEDLSNILKKHSSEVLKNYIKKNDTKIETGNLNNRNDLINFVTEIVVSRNKCNNKLCSCKPRKVSKEVLTDSTSPQENGKETQTSHSIDNSTEKATGVKPIITQKANQTKLNVEEKVTAVQTDDWNHDPLGKCGCCPKTRFETDTKSVVTDKKLVQNATTSDRKITSSKNVFANCTGETKEVPVNTSTKRLCVPHNFENHFKNDDNMKFSACSEKKDCSCDTYDVKEALKRGLILPSSDICIQRKRVYITDDRKAKEESRTKAELNETNSSDGNEISESSSSSNNKKNKGKKKKKKEKKKEKKSKKRKKSDESSSSSSREESKKKKKDKTTNCFGSKKKSSKCDEYCLGISEEHRSMQTIPIPTQDKNEEALFQNKNGNKVAYTSTDSEVATQVSAPSSSDELGKSKQDKETYSKVNKKKDKDSKKVNNQNKGNEAVSRHFGEDVGVTTSRDSKIRIGDQDNYVKGNRERDNRERDNKEKSNEAMICTRCGRLKRDCSSGCRNTIIIPYASSSNRGIPASEVESLKMLIKMQSKDTNRQFDNIVSELNHQKCEVRRLNDMYQKMLESFYDLQKSTNSSRSESKKASDLSHDCRCSNFWNGRTSDTPKECGCSVSNECKMMKKLDTPTKRSNNTSNNSNNSALRRFGPPNTAVAIHRCDICNVEIAGNSIRACIPSTGTDYNDGDKQRKNVLNLSKKTSQLHSNPAKKENVPIPYAGIGDRGLSNTDSLSTIYKKNKIRRKDNENLEKRGGNENIDTRGGNENVFDEKHEFMDRHREQHSPRQQDIRNADTDTTDGSEPGRKTRGIYSSRVLIWLKKSWISIKHRTEECRERERQKREDHKMKCMLNFCHSKAKRAASGIWKGEEVVTFF